MTKNIPAFIARTQFGQILDRVSKNNERFVVTNTALAFLGEFIAFSMAYIVTLRMGKCMIFQEDSAKLPKQCYLSEAFTVKRHGLAGG